MKKSNRFSLIVFRKSIRKKLSGKQTYLLPSHWISEKLPRISSEHWPSIKRILKEFCQRTTNFSLFLDSRYGMKVSSLFTFTPVFDYFKDTVDTDEQLMEIVKRNRTCILNELHKDYAKKGTTDYASRLGELFCLLVHVEVRCSLEVTMS